MLFTALRHNSQSITSSYQRKPSNETKSGVGWSWSQNGT